MRHLSRINHVKEKNPKRQELKKKKLCSNYKVVTLFCKRGCTLTILAVIFFFLSVR